MSPEALQSTPETAPPSIQKTIRAFGQALRLKVSAARDLLAENDQRRQDVYIPFLCANPLEVTGIAVDIGAGAGEFSLPFAAAFPQWKIWCFEPDPEMFALLRDNIEQLKLGNVTAVNIAIGGRQKPLPSAKPAPLKTADDFQKACTPQDYHIDADFPFQLRPEKTLTDEGIDLVYPTLSADLLRGLQPDLLKLTAPNAEKPILDCLAGAEISHIVGETCAFFPSQTLFAIGIDTPPRAFLPVVNFKRLALRSTVDFQNRRPAVDVVVAMYNTKEYILECIEGIIANTADDVRALVVDDGSTDGCGDLVMETYGGNPRVKLLRKANGGCASARNFGRLNSDATHIAFVDADDVIDREMFPQLLDLARYSGAEVVQAGFDFLHMESDGSNRFEDSEESAADFFAHIKAHRFGDTVFREIPSEELMEGQPTIWRRIYRRDYLDSKKIWFPEHIRAFDDQIFQMLTLQYAGRVPALEHVKYHYRQHPGQDIKQGDERFFYSLEMFRTMVKRGINEGWDNFTPLLRSFVNTVNWIYGGLRADLKLEFLKGSAELWIYFEKALGQHFLRDVPETEFAPEDFTFFANMYREKLKEFGVSYAWMYLDAAAMHAPMVKMPDPAMVPARDADANNRPTQSIPDKIVRLGATLVDSPAAVAQAPFDAHGSSVALRHIESEENAFLDGVVSDHSVTLAGTTMPPFVGTHWKLEMTFGGIWLLMNQGGYGQCLAVTEGQVGLAQHRPGHPDIVMHWHILRSKKGYSLCTTDGRVLHVDGDGLTVRPLGDTLGSLTFWEISPMM